MNIQEKETIRTTPNTMELRQTVKHHYNRLKGNTSKKAEKPSLYLVTTKFNDVQKETSDHWITQKRYGRWYPEAEKRIEIITRWQEQFYRDVVKQTISNAHYKSKRKYYPFAISFIDFPGSRDNHTCITEMPHFHSVFVVHPKIVPKFERLMEENFRFKRNEWYSKHLQSIDCKEIGGTGIELFNTLDYSSKFLRQPISEQLTEEAKTSLCVLHGKA